MSEPTDTSGLSAQEREELDRLHRLAEEGNYYRLLGVDPQADAKEIQPAFFAHSKTWHPDRFFRRNLGDDGERLELVFVTLTQAYKTLSDPQRRRAHDRQLEELAQKSAASAAQDERRAARREASLGSTERSVTQPQTAGQGSSERPQKALRPNRSYQPAKNSWSRTSQSRQGFERLRAAAAEQIKRARDHYEQAQAEVAAGNILRANTVILLASEMDPSNEEYKALAAKIQTLTKKAMAVQAANQARSAETFHSVKEAITQYKRAADDYESDDPQVYFRLGLLVLKYEEDERGALGYLRQAVLLRPENPDFRTALGDLYASLSMERNARREYQAALKADKNHQGARDGMKNLKG
jgi:curved DNA-binding protein CbpA